MSRLNTRLPLLLATLLPSAAQALPNPAARYCAGLTGATSLSAGSQGAVGLCQIDASCIEQWTLFRAAAAGRHSQAVDAYLAQWQPAPGTAAAHCNQLGGVVQRLCDGAGGVHLLCMFGDGSGLDIDSLQQGPTAAGQARLARLLGARP